jgi:ferritin
MLSKKIEQAFNEQLNAELYSAYLYIAMAAHFEAENLPGFANWMRVQSQEELLHAVKFYDYINDRDGRVSLKQIAAPPADWPSPLAVFEATLEHEQKVTALINKLADLAADHKDHAATSFLKWFVDEQVEEEKSAGRLVSQLKLIKDNPQGLFMLDRELAARVFTPPPAAAQGAEP